jgi:hypothetical protein
VAWEGAPPVWNKQIPPWPSRTGAPTALAGNTASRRTCPPPRHTTGSSSSRRSCHWSPPYAGHTGPVDWLAPIHTFTCTPASGLTYLHEGIVVIAILVDDGCATDKLNKVKEGVVVVAGICGLDSSERVISIGCGCCGSCDRCCQSSVCARC